MEVQVTRADHTETTRAHGLEASTANTAMEERGFRLGC